MSRRQPITKTVQYSKTMSYLLRHGAVKEGLPITQDGYVNIDDLLNYKTIRGASLNDLLEIVKNCPKQRFKLKNDDDGTIWISATQGHSMGEIEVDLKEITDPAEIQNCIHGTYFQHWDSIRRNGLSRMNRQHIHFSEDFPDGERVISGMRKTCQIAIFVNLKKAIQDGIKFYRSENNVILTKGDENGFLKPIYFEKVVDLKTNSSIDIL